MGAETKADADIAKVLTMGEARRIASNIAKLPTLALACAGYEASEGGPSRLSAKAPKRRF
jgi:hypothetical protein